MTSERGVRTGGTLRAIPAAPVRPDSESLRSWWGSLLASDPPPRETRALWFGLFEGSSGVTLYVQGYPDFDAGDETADWATDEPSWAPEGHYVELAGVQASASWEEALATALGLLRDLQPWKRWPGRLDGVGAGFDDGDAHLLWAPTE